MLWAGWTARRAATSSLCSFISLPTPRAATLPACRGALKPSLLYVDTKRRIVLAVPAMIASKVCNDCKGR